MQPLLESNVDCLGEDQPDKTACARRQTAQDVTDRNFDFQPAYKATSPIQGVRVRKTPVTGTVSIRIGRKAECVEAAFCRFKSQLEMLAAESVK